MEFDESRLGESFPKPGRFLGDRSVARKPDVETVQTAKTLAERSDNPNLTAAKLLDPYRLNSSLPIDHLNNTEQPQYIFLASTGQGYFLITDERVLNMGGMDSIKEYANLDGLSAAEFKQRLDDLDETDPIQAVDFRNLTKFTAKSGIASLKFKYKIGTDPNQKSFSINPNHHDKEELFAAEEYVNNGMEMAMSTQTANQVDKGSQSSSGAKDPLKQIEKLAELKDKGAISEKEFQTKKEDLLESL